MELALAKSSQETGPCKIAVNTIIINLDNASIKSEIYSRQPEMYEVVQNSFEVDSGAGCFMTFLTDITICNMWRRPIVNGIIHERFLFNFEFEIF